jgi:TldD protein
VLKIAAMTVSRRHFLLTTGSAIALAACGPSPEPARGPLAQSTLDTVLDAALSAAKRAGASYADVRIVRRRNERIATRDDVLAEVRSDESYGVGVRVLAMGAWGFAASSNVDAAEASRAAERAVEIAKAHAKLVAKPVELAKVAAYHATWSTDLKVDPFRVPVAERIEMLLAVWRDARVVPEVKHGDGAIELLGEWKLFASSEGSRIEQSVTRVEPSFSVTAIDPSKGDFVTRRHEIAPRQAGWEYVTESTFAKDGRKIADDAVMKLHAPSVEAGKRDLILAPSHLWLVIHESIGHSTELDRAMGYEADLAGTSFATPDKLGKLRYAGPGMTFYGDKTTPGGLATCGFDDDGEQTQRFDIIKDGLFVAYQTTRDEAAWVGETRSRGTSYAQDYRSVAFQRMPNVSLAPGAKEASLDDVVAATDDAVLVTGDGSWSIDHQRYNFQFGGQTFWDVKKGKVVGPLRDVAYQSNTLEMWSSCDMIGGPKSWELHGALHDGKGEPMQVNAVSHGCPPARFRQVNVINTRAKST